MSKRRKMRSGLNAAQKNQIAHTPAEKPDDLLAGLFIALITLLPFLIRPHIAEYVSPRLISDLFDTGMKAEMFYYYKWSGLLIGTAIVLAIFLVKILAGCYEIRKSYLNLPLLVLVLLTVASFVAAEYKTVSLLGLYNLHNGALTYLCYFVLLLAAANICYKGWFQRYVTIALAFLVVINLSIVLAHFFGHDLFQYSAMRDLIIPQAYQNQLSAEGELWSTFEHPNYLSGWAAVMFAYFLTLAVLKTHLYQRIYSLIVAVCSFILILASLSSNGFVTLMLSLPLFAVLIYLSPERKQALKTAGITLLLCIAVFSLMNAYNPMVASEMISFIPKSANSDEQPAEVVDKVDSKPVDEAPPPNIISPASNPFNVPSAHIGWGTGRLYIWAETGKLIQARPFLGYGYDTLAYYFPQNDINKVAEMGSTEQLVHKPHNFYLGMAYGAGIPSMLAVLALFAIHIYRTSRRLLVERFTPALVFPAAIFLSFCVFLIQWLFNDSVIDSSAIFWVLTGAGVSLNRE